MISLDPSDSQEAARRKTSSFGAGRPFLAANAAASGKRSQITVASKAEFYHAVNSDVAINSNFETDEQLSSALLPNSNQRLVSSVSLVDAVMAETTMAIEDQIDADHFSGGVNSCDWIEVVRLLSNEFWNPT